MSGSSDSNGSWWQEWISESTGLTTEGRYYVPLVGVAIDVQARGTASTVTVSQRYINREDATVEAVYTFPLQESAAAFEHYDEALARGDGAYLVDQDRPNLFTASGHDSLDAWIGEVIARARNG
jgi:hypothetical protein